MGMGRWRIPKSQAAADNFRERVLEENEATYLPYCQDLNRRIYRESYEINIRDSKVECMREPSKSHKCKQDPRSSHKSMSPAASKILAPLLPASTTSIKL